MTPTSSSDVSFDCTMANADRERVVGALLHCTTALGSPVEKVVTQVGFTAWGVFGTLHESA